MESYLLLKSHLNHLITPMETPFARYQLKIMVSALTRNIWKKYSNLLNDWLEEANMKAQEWDFLFQKNN